MNERIDVVFVGPTERTAFDEELAARLPHPRIVIVDLGCEPAPRLGADERAVSTVPVPGTELVTAAEAAAAALTGRRTDPAETRAPGRPRPV